METRDQTNEYEHIFTTQRICAMYHTHTFIDLLMNNSPGDLFCEYKYLILPTEGKLHMKTNFMFKQHFRLANSSSITPLTNLHTNWFS